MRDPAEFIRANTELIRPPLVPEIVLHLASEIVPIWRKTEEELAAEGIPPPFWAFAWAGGQALARWVLDNPDAVRGKRVLDFATGSGLSAIAVMKVGAKSVLATDIDPFSIAALNLNATANDVDVAGSTDDVIGRDDGWETVIAGDVCYEREMSARVFDWLKALTRRGATVLVGDPGRNYLPREHMTELAVYDVQTTRELEDREVRRTKVWRVST
ncbi:MAG: methyltransferase [Alphaproteobacteria bacterium]|nr:methyltransferase [Alphaproteobacteria bacterium]